MIRPMVHSDVSGVKQWSEHCIDHEVVNTHITNVLLHEDEVVSYYVCGCASGELQLLSFVVNPSSRGRGYGASMLEDVIDLGGSLECDSISLHVNVNNSAAINLYKKFDFKIIKQQEHYYKTTDGEYQDAFVMIKSFN